MVKKPKVLISAQVNPWILWALVQVAFCLDSLALIRIYSPQIINMSAHLLYLAIGLSLPMIFVYDRYKLLKQNCEMLEI